MLEGDRTWIISRHADTTTCWKELKADLVASDKAAPAESAAGYAISCPAEAAAAVAAPDKAASPEIGLSHPGFVDALFHALSAHVPQQRIDALMVALNRRVWPVQLQQARHHLERQKRHACTPSSKDHMNGPQAARPRAGKSCACFIAAAFDGGLDLDQVMIAYPTLAGPVPEWRARFGNRSVSSQEMRGRVKDRRARE